METEILKKFDDLEAEANARRNEGQLDRVREGIKQLRFDFIEYSKSRTWWARVKRFLGAK